MPKRNGWRLAAALGLLIVLVGAARAAYDAIWPRQSGTNVLTSKSLVVDASNASQGYIMARGDAGNKRLKLRVTQGKYKLTYDLNTSGDYEVFPLQLGDGSYTVVLNARLCREQLLSAYSHEIAHLCHGDYEKTCSVDLIEVHAHQITD